MTQLNDKEHKAQMEDMATFDEQMPSVGIFWYDPGDHTLFGVRKKELTPREVEEAAEKGVPFINYPKLHRQVWAKEYFRAQSKHQETKFRRCPADAFTRRMHRWTIFCQRGNEISRYAGKRGRVDIQDAHNAVFVQTRQGDAEHKDFLVWRRAHLSARKEL